MIDQVQRCIICGEIIIDYRNVMYPKDQGPPTAWQTGPMFVTYTKEGIVTNMYSGNAIPNNLAFLPCNYKS
ncbi:MAG: hypothetical protein V4506_19265 [Bacteroidota bacterium]